MIFAFSPWTAARRLILLAAIPVVLAATPKPPSTTTPTSDATSKRLCDALQALPDARKASCCGTNPSAGLANECADELGRSIQDKSVTLDPADVDRCVAESKHALDGCDWVTPYLPPPPATCRGILHGQLDAGAACRSSLECRDGLHCLGRGVNEPGLCVPPGPAGASCGGAPDMLTSFTRQTDDARHPECTGYCLRGRCVALAAVGGECSSDMQCAPGNHCASRRCVTGPPPKLGEACDGATCAAGLACVDGKCAPPKKAGELCTQPFECEATCLSPTAEKPGTCGMKCSVWPPAGYTPPVATATP